MICQKKTCLSSVLHTLDNSPILFNLIYNLFKNIKSKRKGNKKELIHNFYKKLIDLEIIKCDVAMFYLEMYIFECTYTHLFYDENNDRNCFINDKMNLYKWIEPKHLDIDFDNIKNSVFNKNYVYIGSKETDKTVMDSETELSGIFSVENYNIPEDIIDSYECLNENIDLSLHSGSIKNRDLSNENIDLSLHSGSIKNGDLSNENLNLCLNSTIKNRDLSDDKIYRSSKLINEINPNYPNLELNENKAGLSQNTIMETIKCNNQVCFNCSEDIFLFKKNNPSIDFYAAENLPIIKNNIEQYDKEFEIFDCINEEIKFSNKKNSKLYKHDPDVFFLDFDKKLNLKNKLITKNISHRFTDIEKITYDVTNSNKKNAYQALKRNWSLDLSKLYSGYANSLFSQEIKEIVKSKMEIPFILEGNSAFFNDKSPFRNTKKNQISYVKKRAVSESTIIDDEYISIYEKKINSSSKSLNEIVKGYNVHNSIDLNNSIGSMYNLKKNDYTDFHRKKYNRSKIAIDKNTYIFSGEKDLFSENYLISEADHINLNTEKIHNDYEIVFKNDIIEESKGFDQNEIIVKNIKELYQDPSDSSNDIEDNANKKETIAYKESINPIFKQKKHEIDFNRLCKERNTAQREALNDYFTVNWKQKEDKDFISYKISEDFDKLKIDDSPMKYKSNSKMYQNFELIKPSSNFMETNENNFLLTNKSDCSIPDDDELSAVYLPNRKLIKNSLHQKRKKFYLHFKDDGILDFQLKRYRFKINEKRVMFEKNRNNNSILSNKSLKLVSNNQIIEKTTNMFIKKEYNKTMSLEVPKQSQKQSYQEDSSNTEPMQKAEKVLDFLISDFKEIQNIKSPLQKTKKIMKIFSKIYQCLNPISYDESFSIFVYIVIKSQINDLFLHLQFIKKYIRNTMDSCKAINCKHFASNLANSKCDCYFSIENSEIDYYLTTFEACVVFIERLEFGDLSVCRDVYDENILKHKICKQSVNQKIELVSPKKHGYDVLKDQIYKYFSWWKKN